MLRRRIRPFCPHWIGFTTLWTAGRSIRNRESSSPTGVSFENLGVSCLEPGRSAEHSTNAFAVDYILACDAGHGPFWGAGPPVLVASSHAGAV